MNDVKEGLRPLEARQDGDVAGSVVPDGGAVPRKYTSADIRAALRKRYCHPEACVAFEVAQGTGHLARRHLDAVAMELWPSRGLAISGIEIKVSVYDWRKEKADPTKAEEIARFCDYFWIAAPTGVVPVDELPSAWGLFELQQDGRFVIRKQAEKTEAQALNRPFMAAMLRAFDRPRAPSDDDAALLARQTELEAGFQKRVKDEAQRELGRRNEDAESWRALKAALGKTPDDYLYSQGVAEAVKFVLETNFVRGYGSIRHLHDNLVEMAEKIGKNLELLNVPTSSDMQKLSDNLSGRTRRRA